MLNVIYYPQEGLTALMLATQNGYASAVQTLLRDGKADPNITDKVQCCLCHADHVLLFIVCVQTSGWTAIFFASKQGNTEITRQLIGHGARLDIKDKVHTSKP